MSLGSSSTIATPATTASSVSLPARIISMALSVARSPLALETTSGREPFDCPNATGDRPPNIRAPSPATALVLKKSRRVTLLFMWPPRLVSSVQALACDLFDEFRVQALACYLFDEFRVQALACYLR